MAALPILHKRQVSKPERKRDGRAIWRVTQAFRPYTRQLVLVLLAILLTTGLDLVNPFLIRVIFDDAIGKGNLPLLVLSVSIMLLVPLVTGLIGVGKTYLNTSIAQNVVRDLRNRLYAHVQSMPLRFFTATRTGEIQSRLSNDVEGVQDFVTFTATSMVADIAMVLGTILAMLLISPLLTLISLCLLPLFLWLTYKSGKARRVTSKQTQESLATLTSLMQETLSVSGILAVKTHGRQHYTRERFEAENQTLTALEVRQHMIGRWLFMLIDSVFAIAPAVIYLVAGMQMIENPSSGHITLGSIVAFTTLQVGFLAPLMYLLHVHLELQGALALFDRIFEYLDLPVEIEDAPDAIRLRPEQVRGRVTFRHVSFTYRRDRDSKSEDKHDRGDERDGCNETQAFRGLPDSEDKGDCSTKEQTEKPPSPASVINDISPLRRVHPPRRTGRGGRSRATDCKEPATRVTLYDVSFDVQPGQLVALVGPSGAGKTTITYLVSRLYDVDSGSVAIDGHNVKQIALTSLGELVGVVTQETYLFHTSIKENLLFARPDATKQEIVAAAKAAAIHERILEMPDGYDTIVGERGYKLSGGEKQRLAIARVILKDPRVLILDEATSALDTHSERLIQAALAPLMKNRTTLAIAHRLSTILAADIILVVDKGKVVERGTHHRLLERGGLYARLYHEQFAPLPHEETPLRSLNLRHI